MPWLRTSDCESFSPPSYPSGRPPLQPVLLHFVAQDPLADAEGAAWVGTPPRRSSAWRMAGRWIATGRSRGWSAAEEQHGPAAHRANRPRKGRPPSARRPIGGCVGEPGRYSGRGREVAPENPVTPSQRISKQFLEQIGNHTVPLPTIRRSGIFAHSDLSAEYNPPSMIFLNHFQMKCFMAVEQKGA